jgi:hypothetical protein
MDFDPKEADMKYCGLDLHSNNSVVIVSDAEDRIVFNKLLPNDLGQIRAALDAHQEELAGVVIESTYNWYWLVDGLMDTGYRVHLALSLPKTRRGVGNCRFGATGQRYRDTV